MKVFFCTRMKVHKEIELSQNRKQDFFSPLDEVFNLIAESREALCVDLHLHFNSDIFTVTY